MPFPTNPSVGDKYTQDDTVYTFNGLRWDRTSIGANNETRYGYSTLHTVALLARISALEAILAEHFLILD